MASWARKASCSAMAAAISRCVSIVSSCRAPLVDSTNNGIELLITGISRGTTTFLLLSAIAVWNSACGSRYRTYNRTGRRGCWRRSKIYRKPGFDPKIVDYCLEKDIPVFPGCITPSEVAQAVKRGLKVVKFFPAEPAGGISMIKAMATPYTGIRFMPTGGINEKNLEDYLSCDKILCCGGSWMVKGNLVKAGEFDKIRELTAEAKKLADSIRK